MARILVIGQTGQLGSAFSGIGAVDDSHKWHFAPRATLDLSQTDTVRDFVTEAKADVVINTAAYTAVDKAESEPELAQAINARAPEAMAHACAQNHALLVHYSTDYVFDGSASEPYRETDAVAPLGVYGRTKLAGEQAIQTTHDRHLILRTSWVYDAFGKNFVNTMLRLAGERDELGVVADQHGCPTYAPDLAAASMTLIEKVLAKGNDAQDMYGVYHISGAGQTSWHGFASRIFEIAGKDTTVNAITTADFPTPAPRPAWSVMDNARLNGEGVRMPDWEVALERCLTLRGYDA